MDIRAEILIFERNKNKKPNVISPPTISGEKNAIWG